LQAGRIPHRSSEEAITAVAESPQVNPTSDFGTNEWLVDEMYERYREDPSGVDDTWAEFFRDRDGAGRKSNGAAAQKPADRSKAPASQSCVEGSVRAGKLRRCSPAVQSGGDSDAPAKPPRSGRPGRLPSSPTP
jgi:2-oxoglutarate dehydrogenase E1 component